MGEKAIPSCPFPQESIQMVRWKEYGIVFDSADILQRAMEKLRTADYV